ncbi:hypothetical protein B0H10DRAFT_1939740 [Mycena sp. CBHHK59/15]|nr:hypothetical protein B0H10DRAFT_1939740 [Mycena sp. CBHHK59/15]
MAKSWISYQRLSVDDGEQRPFTDLAGPPRDKWPSRRALFFVIVAQMIGLIWMAFTVAMLRNTPGLLSSIDVVEYGVTTYAIGGDKQFHIPPSPVLDEAWNDLYNFGISQIPKIQAALLPNKTHPIPGDEGNYIVELDVFHNLHCLNMIRKALNFEYYTEMDPRVVETNDHLNHCVDWLRQSLMCAGDTSVVVWQWDEAQKKTTFQGDVAHTCRNFEKLREWGKSHMIRTTYNSSVRIEDDIVIPIIPKQF